MKVEVWAAKADAWVNARKTGPEATTVVLRSRPSHVSTRNVPRPTAPENTLLVTPGYTHLWYSLPKLEPVGSATPFGKCPAALQ